MDNYSKSIILFEGQSKGHSDKYQTVNDLNNLIGYLSDSNIEKLKSCFYIKNIFFFGKLYSASTCCNYVIVMLIKNSNAEEID
jgi:hypothetical protein